MSSKAYRIPGAQDRLRKHSLNLKQLEALIRLRDTARPVLPTKSSGGSPAGSTGGGTGNFLPTAGGVMIGNIAFDPKLIAVSDGRVNLDPAGNPPENSSYIFVAGEGSPDDIRFIDGAERNGQYLIYETINQTIQNIISANLLSFSNIVGDGVTTVTVTLSDTGTLSNGDTINVVGTNNYDINNATVANLTINTSFTYELSSPTSTISESAGLIQDGNIITADGQTLVLDGTLSTLNIPIMTLIFDPTVGSGGVWRVVSTSLGSGGGGGLTEPIILTVNEITPETSPTKSIIDWSKNPNHITIDTDIDFDFSNLPADPKYEGVLVIIDIDGIGGYVSPTWPASVENPPIIETTPNTRYSVMLYTIDGGVTVTHATSVGSSSGGGGVPDGTLTNNHLEWSGAAWVAVETLKFGTGNVATSGKLNFKNDDIGFAWVNATNNGDIQIKATVDGTIDMTRSDNTAMSLAIRSQHLSEDDQILSFTVGSGSQTGADIVMEASTAQLKIAVGGSTRLEIDGNLATIKQFAYSAANPVYQFVRDGTAAIDMLIGITNFQGRKTDTSLNIYAAILGEAASIDDLNPKGRLILRVQSQLFRDGLTLEGITGGEIESRFRSTLLIKPNLVTNALLELEANKMIGVADDPLGTVNFKGAKDDNNVIVYASIHGEISDPTTLSPDGRLILRVDNAGSPVDGFILEGSKSDLVDDVLATVRGELLVKPTTSLNRNALITLENSRVPLIDLSLVGAINFDGTNSVSVLKTYGQILVDAVDVTSETEDGFLALNIIKDGVASNAFTFATTENKSFFPLNMNSQKITSLLDPTADQDGATKKYVDDNAGGTPVGVQDSEFATVHETSQFDHEIWMSHTKQGDLDEDQTADKFITLVADRILFHPYYIAKSANINRIGVEVATGAANSQSFSAAVYDSHPGQPYPKSRISNSVTGVLNVSGIVSAFVNEDVTPGLYWIAIWFPVAASPPALRAFPQQMCNVAGWSTENEDTGAMIPIMAYISDATTNPTLPATPDDDMSVYNFSFITASFIKMLP